MWIGLVLLVATGLCWVLFGVVIGAAERNGVKVGTLQAVIMAGTLTVSFAVLAVAPPAGVPARWLLFTGGSLFLAGAVNYYLLILMGRAMARGPNGIIWAVIQSGLIFPFLVGVIVFGTPFTAVRAAGLGAILAALALFGASRGNTAARTGWRMPMIGAFLLAGIQQNLSALPSYFPEGAASGSVFRSTAAAAGTLAAYLVSGPKSGLREQLRNVRLWHFAAVLLGSTLLSSYFLMYRGIDLVAAAGAGAIGYPVLITACIVGFTLYSRFFLREKMNLAQYAGLGLGIVGIALISLR